METAHVSVLREREEREQQKRKKENALGLKRPVTSEGRREAVWRKQPISLACGWRKEKK